jgi:hypothetical protein
MNLLLPRGIVRKKEREREKERETERRKEREREREGKKEKKKGMDVLSGSNPAPSIDST